MLRCCITPSFTPLTCPPRRVPPRRGSHSTAHQALHNSYTTIILQHAMETDAPGPTKGPVGPVWTLHPLHSQRRCIRGSAIPTSEGFG